MPASARSRASSGSARDPARRHRGHELGRREDHRGLRPDRRAARARARRAGLQGRARLHRPELPRARLRAAGAQPRRLPERSRADRAARRGTAQQGADVAVVEGVMGLFDGASGRGELASTAHVAKLLDAPVLLVVDAASMARSAAAIVHGYRTFDPDVQVAGVIFNRVGSDHHEQLLREALADLGVPVLGALRRDDARRDAGAPPRPRAGGRARGAGARRAGHAERGRGALRRPRRRRAPGALRARARRARPGGPEPRRGADRAAPASRSRAGRRSRSTTARTSSCWRPRAPSCSRSTRCATRRCPRTPAR